MQVGSKEQHIFLRVMVQNAHDMRMRTGRHAPNVVAQADQRGTAGRLAHLHGAHQHIIARHAIAGGVIRARRFPHPRA